MAIVSIAELKKNLPAGGRLLGLDLGEKTIGLALSDRNLTIGSPLETLRRAKITQDAAALAKICAERGIAGLLLGLPINMDGSEGPRAQSVRQFARNLEQVAGFELPVGFWDERLSTAAVERLLVREADMSRRRRAQVIDKMAAAYILQGALDSLRHLPDGKGAR